MTLNIRNDPSKVSFPRLTDLAGAQTGECLPFLQDGQKEITLPTKLERVLFLKFPVWRK